VHLLRSGWLPPVAGESRSRGLLRGREVILECDGVPVIFAHSVLLSASRGRLSRWLDGLASRSLGSLLFTCPGFKREPLEFCKLDAAHPLHQRAATWAGGTPELWARRSVHRLGRQALLVTEVFLPGIGQIGA
jgi:chorismate--pyruvate lyase